MSSSDCRWRLGRGRTGNRLRGGFDPSAIPFDDPFRPIDASDDVLR